LSQNCKQCADVKLQLQLYPAVKHLCRVTACMILLLTDWLFGVLRRTRWHCLMHWQVSSPWQCMTVCDIALIAVLCSLMVLELICLSVWRPMLICWRPDLLAPTLLLLIPFLVC
jgi:hypothetical protein